MRPSRHISIGESPDFVMRRGEMELNHQAVLKVYLFDSGIPTLKDSKAPFGRYMLRVVYKLEAKLTAEQRDELTREFKKSFDENFTKNTRPNSPGSK